MADSDVSGVTREELIQGLQEDIAREYQAIIQYVIFSQKLDGARYMEIAQILEGHAHEELDHAIAIAKQLVDSLRELHDLTDEAGDAATTSLIENWIDEGERRTWFLFETLRKG